MTTRIEELTDKLISILFVEGILDKEQLKPAHFICLEAITQARQVGRDEAVDVVKGYLTQTTDIRITKAQMAKALLTLTNKSTTR